MNNPFTSYTYQVTWLKHFANQKQAKAFNFIDGLKFYKHNWLPYYINVGKNFTNGITYTIDDKAKDYKNKTLLIYDVPSYQNVKPPSSESYLKLKQIEQYKGYLADFTGTKNLDDYLAKEFNNKSRNKFRSTLRKFEKCFNVSYQIYHGSISKPDYNHMMNEFKGIIQHRFETLKLDTNLIGEWPFYTDLVYDMILKGSALVIAIKANNKPVSMSLVFVSEKALIGAIKAFDSDYYKFNVGHVEISKLIEYCLENGLQYLDFSKGSYEYKSKWTNVEYQYHCHILYDNSSFKSRLIAKLLTKYFEFKQYLRDKNINLLWVKVKYRLKHLGKNKNDKMPFKILPCEDLTGINTWSLVDLHIENKKYPFLNRIIFDRLYQKPEAFSNLKIYKSHETKTEYYVLGESSNYKIEII